MTVHGHPYQPAYVPTTPPPLAPPPAKSVLPAISLVVSALALIGVIGLAVALGAAGVFGAGGQAPLTGQLSSAPVSALRGDALARDLTGVINDDGGDVSDLRCPDTPSVRQGVVSVCHGTISGGAWAVAVFFDDSQGRFTALPM